MDNKTSWTNPHENYSEILDDYTIIGVPRLLDNKNIIIGFIYKKSKIISPENIDLFEKYSAEIVSKIPEKAEKISETFQCELGKFSNYFTGSTEIYLDFLERFNALKILNSNIFIEGKKGTGKEILARLFHEEGSNRTKDFLTIYCDKIPEEIFINKYIETLISEDSSKLHCKAGTVYFEAIDSLSYKSQELLTRLLESKLVNSTPLKTSETKRFRFIFSSEKSLKILKSNKYILEKLLARINVMTIIIPEIKEIRMDLKELIDSRINKFSNKYCLKKIRFSDDLIERLLNNEWEGNYRELDKVIEGIIRNGRHEEIIDIDYYNEVLNSNLINDKLVKTIDDVEQEHIERVLKLLNFNLVESSKALGISRSTLYRKIEKYNINI